MRMRVEGPKGKDCNSCVAFKCHKIHSEYPKVRIAHKLSASELAHMQCSNYTEARTFKMPLLMHLATDLDKVAGMNGVLSEFNFRLEERNKYPYFGLLMKRSR